MLLHRLMKPMNDTGSRLIQRAITVVPDPSQPVSFFEKEKKPVIKSTHLVDNIPSGGQQSTHQQGTIDGARGGPVIPGTL